MAILSKVGWVEVMKSICCESHLYFIPLKLDMLSCYILLKVYIIVGTICRIMVM